MAVPAVKKQDPLPPPPKEEKVEPLKPEDRLMKKVLDQHRTEIDQNQDGNVFAEWNNWKQSAQGREAILDAAGADKSTAKDLIRQSANDDAQSMIRSSQAKLDQNQNHLNENRHTLDSHQAKLDAEWATLDQMSPKDSGLKAARADLASRQCSLDLAHAAQDKAQKIHADAQSNLMNKAWASSNAKDASHAVQASNQAIKECESAISGAKGAASHGKPDAASGEPGKEHKAEHSGRSERSGKSDDHHDAEKTEKSDRPNKAEGKDKTQGDKEDDTGDAGKLKLQNKALARYEKDILAASKATGIDANVIAAQMWHESRGNMDVTTTNSDGTKDIGLMQIGQRRANEYMKHFGKSGELDVRDPADNIMAGALELKYWLQQSGGDLRGALNGYVSGDVNGGNGIGDPNYASNCMRYATLIKQGESLPDSD